MANSYQPAIVLGGGMNGLAFVRSLGRRGVDTHVLVQGPADLVARSRHVAGLRVADCGDSMIDEIESVAGGLPGKPVLFYTSDRYVRLVARHRDRLAECVQLVAPSLEAVETVSDKGRFARFAESNGLPTPATRIVAAGDDPGKAGADLRFPVVIKPGLSRDWKTAAFQDAFGPHKAIRIDSADEYASLAPSLLAHSSSLIVQEYIPGPDDAHYSVCCHRHDGVINLALAVRKRRIFPIHRGAGSLIEIVSRPDLESLAHQALDAVDFEGVASVCCKIDERDDRPVIHEINGRPPQWHSIFKAAGVDLPWLLYCRATGRSLPDIQLDGTGRKWIGIEMDLLAARQYQRRGELGLRGWLRSLRGVRSSGEFAWDDPVPLLATLWRVVRSRIG